MGGTGRHIALCVRRLTRFFPGFWKPLFRVGVARLETENFAPVAYDFVPAFEHPERPADLVVTREAVRLNGEASLVAE